MYAFANINSSGGIVLADSYADLQKHYANDSWTESGNNVYGCIKQFYLLKMANRQLKLSLSVGGWSYSPSFSAPMATAAGRQLFADSAVQMVANLGLDGIDIDWEV
jgi:chitinase